MMENPFRLLDYYRYEDAPFFFGREEETAKMVGEILSTRLLVLFSPSGSGKTSLINAGVRPELERMGYRTVYTRMEGEPAAGICKAAAEALGLEKNTPGQGQGFYDFLKQEVQETGKPLVIFLDQFEEFFIVFKDNDALRREFIEDAAKIKYDEQLPVFLVLSLREDYFAHLHEFRPAIPSIFNNNANIRLGPFTEKAGRRVMEESLKQVGWTLAEGLADRVLADLKGLKKGGTGIEPMSLQMVCGALWQGRGKGEEKVIGPGVYDACGGAEKILTRYVHDCLAKVPRQQQGLMVKVFETLKTPDNTKRYRSLDDLQTQLGIKKTGRLAALLAVLAKEGILREEEKEETCWYEFKHDLLVPEINGWIITRQERHRRRRFIYAVLPWIILFLILTIYFFIEYNIFYAVFSGVDYSSQEQEIIIIRGFNPFRERSETGLFKSDVKDAAAENRIKSKYKVGFWNRNDWTALGDVLKLDKQITLLARLGQEERSYKLYLQGQEDNYRNVRFAPPYLLGQVEKAEPALVKALITALKDKESYIRSAAAVALGQLGKEEPAVVQALIHALKDDYANVRLAAAEALRQLGKSEPAVVQALITALKDDYANVRLTAAEALGQLGKAEPEVPQVLINALKDNYDNVRSAAARALGQLGKADLSVIKDLISVSKDKEWNVRSAAAVALGQLGKAEPDVLQALIVALKDEEKYVRFSAAESLIKLGKSDLEVIHALISVLEDKDTFVRNQAAEALGQLGKAESDVVQSLIVALQDKEGYVRSAAAEALGQLGKAEPAVIQTLIVALNDKEWNVQTASAGALGKLGKAEPDVIKALMASLKDDNSEVQSAAAKALDQLKKTDQAMIQAPIVELKDDEMYVSSAAAESLGQLGKAEADVIKALIKALKAEDDNVRSAAAKELEKLGKADDEVVQALIAALKDENKKSYREDSIRHNAAEALGKLFCSKSEAELLSYLQDTRSAWRTIGAYALAAKGKAALSPQTLREIDSLKDTDPRPCARLGSWLAYERLNRKQENW